MKNRLFKQRKLSTKERVSLYVAISPDKAILAAILFVNISLVFLAALIISQLVPSSVKDFGFWSSVFYSLTMILDAGCISYVVDDVGQTGFAVIVLCVTIVLVGMITFTGAVIGYVTNYISKFIESSSSGERALNLSGHTIILNWNSRAAEIVNDMLYLNSDEIIVILVRDNKNAIKEELNNRISSTIENHNEKVIADAEALYSSLIRRYMYIRSHRLRNRLSVVIREGDVLSKTQLSDISLKKAKTIMILGRDYQSRVKNYYGVESLKQHYRGNSNVVKTLMLVSDMAGKEGSANGQRIVVEVEDQWTMELVEKISAHKEHVDKCSIITVPVNQIIGKLLSQLAIMPGLNAVYDTLLSNNGFVFVSAALEESFDMSAENDYFQRYLYDHRHSIPLSVMETKEGKMGFYLYDLGASKERVKVENKQISLEVKLNKDYYITSKHIIILGHNSAMDSIMTGFDAFQREWKLPDGSSVLDILVIDDKTSLRKHNYYRQYPYVTECVTADIYDKEIIYDTISQFADRYNDDISVMILSDDQVPVDEIDEKPLAYLIYMDDMLHKRQKENPKLKRKPYDIITEILNPQNLEAVMSYSSNYVVVSNQYISHMLTQIGENVAIYDFFKDILTYDDDNTTLYESKELYLKKADEFFVDIPPRCTAHELVRAVFDASEEFNKQILMGYMHGEDKEYVFFAGDNYNKEIEIQPWDYMILCSYH